MFTVDFFISFQYLIYNQNNVEFKISNILIWLLTVTNHIFFLETRLDDLVRIKQNNIIGQH